MKFNIVNLYYPNNWRKAVASSTLSSSKDINKAIHDFSWFLCSYRALDTATGLFYLSISPDVQFFSPKTGESLLARGLSKRGEGIETETVRPRLVILSDPHNKEVMCRKYTCPLKCDSKRSTLSPQCELVSDHHHLKKMAAKAVQDLGFDGVAIRHECVNKSLDRFDMPVCQEATFVFREGILEDLGDNWPTRCGIVKYAKKNNTCIRKIIPEFPTVQEIDDTLEETDCSIVSQVLYDYIVKYMENEHNM